MKRLPIPILLTLLLASIAAGAVTIEGPDQLDVKEADLFYVKGLTIQDFANCEVQVYPETTELMVLVLQTINNDPVLYVKGRAPGKFALTLDVNVPGAYELCIHELTIGSGPEPEPDPIPPPVPGELSVVVVHETSDRTAQQSAALLGLQKYLDQKSHPWRFADKDLKDGATNQPAEWLKPYLTAISKAQVNLPVLVIGATSDGAFSIVSIEPLPDTATAAIALIQKHGG